jgi:rRNA maturation endonuclease Nob1
VLEPLLRPAAARPPHDEPLDPEETPRGIALAALKEIEFDRATGKLSDADYEQLKARYTANALAVLRAESTGDDVERMIGARTRALRAAADVTSAEAPRCPGCGPRPEPDAVFCSSCGSRVAA